jgi:hypothetical protein
MLGTGLGESDDNSVVEFKVGTEVTVPLGDEVEMASTKGGGLGTVVKANVVFEVGR